MNAPDTVTTAIDDVPVEGAVCLEAGAGSGKMTAGLLQAGSSRVYAITDERRHATTVLSRLDEAAPDEEVDERVAVLEADLRDVPLPSDSVEVVTAHALFNVLTPEDAHAVISELTRVAKPGCHLVLDDYDPLCEDAAVRELFSVENAATELSDGRSALTFYPSALLRRLLAGYGWAFERERTLLDPVPWTEHHLRAHAIATREATESLPDALGDPLRAEAKRLVGAIEREETGRMYSLAFQLPE